MDADRCIILFIIKPKIPCLFKKYFLQIVERKDQVQHVLMLSSYAVSIHKKKPLIQILFLVNIHVYALASAK